MIGIIRSCVCNIIQHFFSVQTVPLGNGEQAYWTESSFGVDVQAFAFAATHVDR